MKVSISTILSWFKTGLKPTQEQFFRTWSSFWHKDEIIPVSSIENLEQILSEKAELEIINNHIQDNNAHGLDEIWEIISQLQNQGIYNISDQEAKMNYQLKGNDVFCILIPFDGNGINDTWLFEHNLYVSKYIKVEVWIDQNPNGFFIASQSDLSPLINTGELKVNVNRVEFNGYQPPSNPSLYLEYTKNTDQGVSFDVIGNTTIS